MIAKFQEMLFLYKVGMINYNTKKVFLVFELANFMILFNVRNQT